MADDNISKNTIFESIVKEAGEFYKQVVTVSSAFIGGTLLFLEKIAPHPTNCSIIFLTLGLLLLVFAIGIATWVRLGNIQSGTLVLENKIGEAQKLDKHKEGASVIMTIFLTGGILLVVIFGVINVWGKGEVKKVSEEEKSRILNESIPFGNSGSQKTSGPEIANSIPFGVTGEQTPAPPIPGEDKKTTKPEK